MTNKRIGMISAIRQWPVILILFSLNLYSQDPLPDISVTLKTNNKPLYAILDDLTVQTGYRFTFDSRVADSRQKITLNIQKILLTDALDTLFGNPELSYGIIHRNIVIYPPKKNIPTAAYETPSAYTGIAEINGWITDEKTGKPLPYATIGVMDTHMGTVSNMNGYFSLRLPDTLRQPVLAISYIGYKSHYVPVITDLEEPMKITMSRNLISLQEVIIRYQDPVTLLEESLRRIGSNYLSAPSGMIGYYRERVQKEDKCMIFSEAVVEMAKASYSGVYHPDRTRLLKGRKVTHIDPADTVVLKIKSGITTMLELDIIRQLPDFLETDFRARYSYSFDNVVTYGENLVYVIRFQPRESMEETLFRGSIYLDRESLAIIAADFEYDPVKIGREQEMFVSKKSKRLHVRPVAASYHVEYQQTDGRYHLSQVRGEVQFKVRKRREWIASKYTILLEMAITAVNPGLTPQIRLNETVKPGIIVSDQPFKYDPEFWGEYNTIAPEVSLEEVLLRMEKSLQEISR